MPLGMLLCISVNCVSVCVCYLCVCLLYVSTSDSLKSVCARQRWFLIESFRLAQPWTPCARVCQCVRELASH